MTKFDHKYYNKAQNHLLISARVKNEISQKYLNQILKAAKLIIDTFQNKGKLLICGNGGSAADCQHMASEFVSRLTKDFDRPGLPAIALTTDSSFLTAYSNDVNFDGIFERQIQALGEPKDALIGISTSGNSKNVIRALLKAKKMKMHTLALIGQGGKIKSMDLEVIISVPNNNTQHIQEAHLAIEHIICEIVEEELFRK